MNNYQEIQSKENKGFEFLKIYGITLIVAFFLTTVVQHEFESRTFSDGFLPEQPAVPAPPMADADKLLPLKKLKKIFVNLSF